MGILFKLNYLIKFIFQIKYFSILYLWKIDINSTLFELNIIVHKFFQIFIVLIDLIELFNFVITVNF